VSAAAAAAFVCFDWAIDPMEHFFFPQLTKILNVGQAE
jgi:hypothetical protein